MTTFKEYLQLDELIGVKKFHGKSKAEVIKQVKKEGKYKLLGKGAHGHAFEYKGAVYKFWSYDPPYDAFVKYALANQDNPFVPKIFSKKIRTLPASFLSKHPDHPDTVNWIKMEKLTPGKATMKVTAAGHPLSLTTALGIARHSSAESSGSKYSRSDRKELIKRSLVWYAMSKAEPKKYNVDEMFTKPMPGKLSNEGEDLLEFLLGLVEVGDANGVELDDHKDDNFMMRGSQVVFIDPFFTYEAVEKNREMNVYDFSVDDFLDSIMNGPL